MKEDINNLDEKECADQNTALKNNKPSEKNRRLSEALRENLLRRKKAKDNQNQTSNNE